MKHYQKVDLNIYEFPTTDVICASVGPDLEDTQDDFFGE